MHVLSDGWPVVGLALAPACPTILDLTSSFPPFAIALPALVTTKTFEQRKNDCTDRSGLMTWRMAQPPIAPALGLASGVWELAGSGQHRRSLRNETSQASFRSDDAMIDSGSSFSPDRVWSSGLSAILLTSSPLGHSRRRLYSYPDLAVPAREPWIGAQKNFRLTALRG